MSRAPNINRSKVHEPMVQRLCVDKLPETDKCLFPTIREFMSFAALLGYSEGRKIPLDRDKGVEDIAGAQYEHHEAYEILFALAVAAEKSSDILKENNESKCVEIYEDYANGGMTLISEWLIAGADKSPDRAIYSGLIEAGYLSLDQDDDVETSIAGINF